MPAAKSGARKSTRNLKRIDDCSKGASSVPTSDHNMDIDESVPEMDEFSLNVSPTKGGPSIERGAPSFSGQHIYELLTARGAALKLTIDDWQELFITNSTCAILQLINSMFWAGSIRTDLQLTEFTSEEEPSEILNTFQDSLDPDAIGINLLIGKKKQAQQFQRAYFEFFTKLIQSTFVNIENASSVLQERFLPWLLLTSTSQFRPLRQASSFAAFAVLVGLAKASSELSGQLERASKVTRGNVVNLVDSLTAQIAGTERVIQQLFSSIYVQRFRDVDKEIRRVAIVQLGKMVQAQSSLFLDNHYLRYLGWGLSDKISEVRLSALESLGDLYRDKDSHTALSAFTERFTTRIIEIAQRDVDEEVRKEGQSLVLRLFSSDLIPLEELSFVDRIILRQSSIGKEGEALIYARVFGQAPDESDKALFDALCSYLESITIDSDIFSKLTITEFLVASIDTSFASDPTKCIEMVAQSNSDFALPILEASYRHIVYPHARSRVVPTKPSGLESSRHLTETMISATIELMKGLDSISELGYLSLFEIIPLFDFPNKDSEYLISELFTLFSLMESESEAVIMAAVKSFQFVKNVESISSFVEEMLRAQLATCFTNGVKENEDFSLAKASFLIGTIRLPTSCSIDDAINKVDVIVHSLRLLYHEFLWRLSEQKLLQVPTYEQIIPLRDEILSFQHDSITFRLIWLDMLFLFGPSQEWMSETWRYPIDQDMSELVTLLGDSVKIATKDEVIRIILGIARLSCSGYQNTSSLVSLMISWYGVYNEDYILAAIDHIQKNAGIIPIVTSLNDAVTNHYQLVIENEESFDNCIELNKTITTTIKKSNQLSEIADQILVLHATFINWIAEHFNEQHSDALGSIASLYVSLLPPSVQLNLDPLRSLRFTKRTENIQFYLKSLDKHLSKGSKTKRLPLTPQKRRTRGSVGESRLKVSHSMVVDDVEIESEEGEEKEHYDDDISFSQAVDDEDNPFIEMKAANESNGSVSDSLLPLRKKTVLRS